MSEPFEADLDVGGEGWRDAEREVTPALASLRVPNFRKYFIGQTLSNVGTWFHTLAGVEDRGAGRDLSAPVSGAAAVSSSGW